MAKSTRTYSNAGHGGAGGRQVRGGINKPIGLRTRDLRQFTANVNYPSTVLRSSRARVIRRPRG